MSKRNQTPPKNFEDAIKELEEIVAQIERGEIGLEESLLKYERGHFLVQHCHAILNNAERQIEQVAKAANGSLKTEPIAQPEEPS